MAKVSGAYKDAVTVSMGVQEGFYEITNTRVVVHQFPPNAQTGVQSDPGVFVAVDFAQLDDRTAEKLDEDAQTEYFSIGSMDRFHPGLAENRDDAEPVDQGTEVGAEGNCIYSVQDGYALSTSCKWIMFTKSMEDKGFKSDILANGYWPDLIGTKLHVKTVAGKRWSGSKSTKDPTQLVCEKIDLYPWDKKSGKKGAAPAAKGKGTATAKSSDEPTPESIAAGMFKDIAKANAGKEMARAKLQGLVQTGMMKNRTPPKLYKPVLDVLKDDDQLIGLAVEVEATVDLDAGTVTFAE